MSTPLAAQLWTRLSIWRCRLGPRRVGAILVLSLSGCLIVSPNPDGVTDGGATAPASTEDAPGEDAGTVPPQAPQPAADDGTSSPTSPAPADTSTDPSNDPKPVVSISRMISGCADGTREAFTDTDSYPTIAGCAGAWRRQGLITSAALTPGCNRQAGNDGTNRDGKGCAAADLCAAGWRPCNRLERIKDALDNPDGCQQAVSPSTSDKPYFFAAAVASTPVGLCINPPREGCEPSAGNCEANDLLGCGNVGATTTEACAPLTRRINFADCAALPGWDCGGLPDKAREALVVTKTSPKNDAESGGILCCADL